MSRDGDLREHASVTRGPWPGPRPYREADRQRYFGREHEKYELLERLDADRLVLLTAPSAVGKTSFLRAGIVPELRRRRRAELARGLAHPSPAALVVRDWAIPDRADADKYFIEAIREGIKDLSEELDSYDPEEAASARQDYEALATVEPGASAFAYVTALAATTGGLTLILDQFEEALQGSGEHLSYLSRLISRIYKRGRDVSLLISFREEAWIRFGAIGGEVGDINARTYYLRPIPDATLREAVVMSGRVGGVNIDDEALNELLAWMDAARMRERDLRTGPRSLRRPAPARLLGLAENATDLLRLQSLLLELYDVAEKRSSGGQAVIDRDTLRALKDEAVGSGAASAGADVVEGTLKRFVDRLIPMPHGVAAMHGLAVEDVLDEADDKLLRMRRAAARMGPSFSSGGFKVQQEEAALLARSWREEWEVLDVEVDEVEDVLGSSGDIRADAQALFAELLPATESELEADEPQSFASGIAKRARWSRDTIASDLIETSIGALDLLSEGNVIRRKVLQSQVTYELVHDGFGDALFDWAEDSRGEPLDALIATTAERGTAFRWARLTGLVRDMRWRGCWVGPDRDKSKRLLLEDVTFAGCDLRGTVFEDCDFVGGAFSNCDLSGAVFWGCSFDGADRKPYRFEAIAASGLNFDEESSLTRVEFAGQSRLHNMSWDRVTVRDVVFVDCVLNQMTIGDVTIAGGLEFVRCAVLLSDLVNLSVPEPHGDGSVAIRDCDLLYCRLGETARSALGGSDSGNELYPKLAALHAEPRLRTVPTNLDVWKQPS